VEFAYQAADLGAESDCQRFDRGLDHVSSNPAVTSGARHFKSQKAAADDRDRPGRVEGLRKPEPV
jgi:hypothetical protein